MRSRRRVALIAAASVAVIIAVGVPWALSGDDRPATPQRAGLELVGATLGTKTEPAAAGPVAEAEKAFSLALLRELGGDGKTNVSVSPASLSIALSMLQNGAAGKTRDEIQKTLHGPGTQAQNAGWRALTHAWAAAATDGSFTLSSANGAWLQQGLPVASAFLDALKTYYGAGVWTVDFSQQLAAALAAVNNWTSRQTNGKIPKLFDQLDPATVLVLADAVYFKADWADPFDPKATERRPFTRADGTTVKTPFMIDDQGTYPAAVTPDYAAVQLPYRGGQFAALALMPRDQSLADFTAGLSTATLDRIVTSLRAAPVDLAMPKFRTRSKLELNGPLSALGMPTAFTDAADFSAMTSQPVDVAKVIQRVYLSVAEKGTEAAAATGVDVRATSARAPGLAVAVDHPFLFLIRDTKTGAILFAAQIADPTTS
jgi:serpin B